MRVVFLLLVLANAAFYAYAFVARDRHAVPDAARLQLNAERIRIIRPAGDKLPAASACLEWGVLTGADLARAEAALARLDLPAASLQREGVAATGYWVHIPPLKSKAELEKKLAELKGFGVTEFSPVQDPSLGRNAISLGVFSTEEAAQSHLAMLKEQGVRSAAVESRPGMIRQTRFLLREPGEDVVARLAEIQREFPATRIRATSCPAAAEAKK
jgi:hypothetical protein